MNVLLKPRERMLRHLLKCAGLFEEMRCTGHDYQTFRTGKQSVGYSIHLMTGSSSPPTISIVGAVTDGR